MEPWFLEASEKGERSTSRHIDFNDEDDGIQKYMSVVFALFWQRVMGVKYVVASQSSAQPR